MLAVPFGSRFRRGPAPFHLPPKVETSESERRKNEFKRSFPHGSRCWLGHLSLPNKVQPNKVSNKYWKLH